MTRIDGLVRPVQSIGTYQEIAALAPPSNRWVVFGCPLSLDALHADSTPYGGPESIRGAFPYFEAARGAEVMGDWESGNIVPIREMVPADVGDLELGDRADLESYGASVNAVVQTITERGGRPLMLGGEHSLTRFSVDALASIGSVWVVHLDAHSDVEIAEPLSPLTNGNVMSYVEQLSNVAGVVHAGVREYEFGSQEAVVDLLRGDAWLSSSRFGQLGSALSKRLPPDAKVYLSIDIDVLDPGVNPNIAWPSAGGISVRELVSAVADIAATYEVIGADIVELTAAPHTMNLGAIAASRLIMALLSDGRVGAQHGKED
ncbi:arginase family protein [Microbacterium laevaniformans]|uniref:arginase family protein n=1 Tax=Microbacterium laevaniformans TaxID=36807 RepID=UPI00362A653E